MKTKEILDWIVKNSINGEFLGIVEVPAEDDFFNPQDEDWWLSMFGGLPPSSIPAGRYLYFYTDMVTDWPFADIDAEVALSFDNCVNLYKIED